MRPTLFELAGVGIAGRLNFLLDADDLAIHLVILVEEPAEMRVMRLQLRDGLTVFGEFADERVMKIGGF